MILRALSLSLSLSMALIFSSLAEARVFTIDSESFGAYLRGSYGPGVINTLNSESRGANVTLDSSSTYNLSGEFGFVFANPAFNLRFGLEVIRPPDVKDGTGVNSSGASMYSMTSEMSILAPKVSAEFTLNKWPVSKLFLEVGAGYASLAARNSYAFTAAGSTQFGLADFYEDLRAGAPLYQASLGFESLLTDTTTYVIEGGYRMLNFTSIKYNNDIANFEGAAIKGGTATNTDGSDRTLNLNNYFLAMSLRFWLY